MSGRKTRKLLTAAVGVATVSYVAGCGRTAAGFRDEGRQIRGEESTEGDVVNGTTDPGDTTFDPGEQTVISGNLVAPPPTTQLPPSPSTQGPVDVTDYTFQPWDTTQGPSESSFIAGNLLPPPSSTRDWATEPPLVTDATDTGSPPSDSGTVPTSDGASTIPYVSGSQSPATTDSPLTTEPPAATEQPDAGASLDASVSEGAQSQ